MDNKIPQQNNSNHPEQGWISDQNTIDYKTQYQQQHNLDSMKAVEWRPSITNETKEYQLNEESAIQDKTISDFDQTTPKSYQLVQKFIQRGNCYAMAFNNTSNLLVTGCQFDIKVWSFENGQMKETHNLVALQGDINCLVFSKKINWFLSSQDSSILGWKEDQNGNWIHGEPKREHTIQIMSLVLNTAEDELISCCYNLQIKVWKINCQHNQITYNYTLEQKHKTSILAMSLNSSETYLISSCVNIILWIKGKENKWQFQNVYSENKIGYRIGFASETQVIYQSIIDGSMKILEIINGNFKVNEKLTISYEQEKRTYDQWLYPIIYNKKRNIIITKFFDKVYIIKKRPDETFDKILKPIDSKFYSNFGVLSENGEYLINWNSETKQFRVHKINY